MPVDRHTDLDYGASEMEVAMNDLQTALSLLQEEFGPIDNVKLQLGGGEGMTQASVSAELLAIARAVRAGEIVGVNSHPEHALKNAPIEA